MGLTCKRLVVPLVEQKICIWGRKKVYYCSSSSSRTKGANMLQVSELINPLAASKKAAHYASSLTRRPIGLRLPQ